MTFAPFIGAILDYSTNQTYSKFPWYAIRENYFTSISQAGGVPLGLPYEEDFIEDYLSQIQGLLLIGGDFDINPVHYGIEEIHPTVMINDKRTSFEIKMAGAALKKNLPILGICGGHQLINVVLGGTLIQHIPDEVPNAMDHNYSETPSKCDHHITVLPNTLLASIIKDEKVDVNTSHHQAILKPGKGVIVNAVAPDGIIEGIEVPAKDFCLGVQWHPEFKACSKDDQIFEAFIEAARNYARSQVKNVSTL